MCILLVSTQHPKYPLILLSNRDEYLQRLTQRASWWDSPSTSHILGGRDLERLEKGTWLGITRQGRIAALTNVREESSAAATGTRSRGAMVNSFLKSPVHKEEPTKTWVERMLTADGDEGVKGVGGFSLLCGTIRPRPNNLDAILSKPVTLEPLAIISNRTSSIHWICGEPNEVHGLSNSFFDNPMPKVILGEKLLRGTLDEAIASSLPESILIDRLFSLLSHDTFPITKGNHTYQTDLDSLKHSIFIPAFKTCQEESSKEDATHHHLEGNDPLRIMPEEPDNLRPDSVPMQGHIDATAQNGDLTVDKIATAIPSSLNAKIVDPENLENESNSYYTSPTIPDFSSNRSRIYGTQKQTIILVDREGHVKYIERTLYDNDTRWVGDSERDTFFEFDIEGWK